MESNTGRQEHAALPAELAHMEEMYARVARIPGGPEGTAQMFATLGILIGRVRAALEDGAAPQDIMPAVLHLREFNDEMAHRVRVPLLRRQYDAARGTRHEDGA